MTIQTQRRITVPIHLVYTISKPIINCKFAVCEGDHGWLPCASVSWLGIDEREKKSVSRRVSFIEKGQIDKWGQRRQADILREYDNQALDLSSCMTLDVENCHAIFHSKKVNMSSLEYARLFGATRKSVKSAVSWAAYYHTSRKSRYPRPEARHNAVSW